MLLYNGLCSAVSNLVDGFPKANYFRICWLVPNTMHTYFEKLKERFEKPLPGVIAHDAMATLVRQKLLRTTPKNPRISAVLIALFVKDENVYFPVIRRPSHNAVHAGQIGLPGGGMEKQDSNLVETALRETEEEIGLKVPKQQVLGTLTPLYIPPSNAQVTPVVAYTEPPKNYIPDPREVDYVLDIPIDELLKDKSKVAQKVKVFGDLQINAPGFHIAEAFIWGATAMMLSEFLHIWKDARR